MAARGYSVYIVCGLAAAVFLVFGASLGYPFVNYDDPHYVINNYSVQRGINAEAIAWAFSTSYAENWHPLTWLSHMLDFQLYGMRPGAHRLTNVLLHLAAAVTLFAALRRLTGAAGRSAFVAALFAIHPLHVESVVWIAERKDVLSGFFWMLTLWCYAYWRENPRAWRYAALIFVLALGLLSKSMLVTLPCVLLLLDYWPLRRIESLAPRRALPLVAEKLPLFALSALFCAITFIVQNAGGTVKSFDAIPFGARAANAVVAYGAYLWKTVYPFELAVLYPHSGTAIPWGAFFASFAALAVLSVAVWRLRTPYPRVGWLWFLGTLVPVIGLVQVGDQAYADRYTYIPLVGLFIAAAWGGWDLWRRFAPAVSTRAVAAACAALLAATGGIAAAQVRHWSSSIALFERCVALTPRNPAAYNNLGRAYHDARRLDDAKRAYAIALEQGPHLGMIRNNLALVYLDTGEPAAAEAMLRAAIDQGSRDARVYLNLGIALAAQDRKREAADAMAQAIAIAPGLVSARFSLGLLLVESGESGAAIPHLEAALALQPGHTDARGALARAYESAGREDEAHEQLAIIAETPGER